MDEQINMTTMIDIDDKKITSIYEDLKAKIEMPLNDSIKVEVDGTKFNYISDVVSDPSYALKYNLPLNDLPHNAYINKGITGCGGTTLVLTNNENYIIAVHSTNLISNKVAQYKNKICGVYSETTNDDIKLYLENQKYPAKKIMVTYDSLPRLMEIIDPTQFRLLVDEVHVLIRYLGHFKTSVCHSLLECTYKFKSTSFLTATPTERPFLPEPLKCLDYIEYKWNNVIKPDIKHMYCGKQIQTKVVAFINDKLNNTNDEIYIFYNSKAGVVTTIKKLLMIRDDLTLADINIVFANTDENIKYFKKSLKNKNIDIGTKLVVDENGLPLPGYNKRVNFISSFGFEGVDFYTHGKDVISLIVADASSKSMRYDISIDIPQILGRFRRDLTTRLFPKNEVYFIWKSVELEVDSEFDHLVKDIATAIFTGENLLENYRTINISSPKTSAHFKERVLSSWAPYIIPDDSGLALEDQTFITNKYAMEGVLSVYLAMNIDYCMAGNFNDDVIDNTDSFIINNLKSLCNKINTFEIESLSNKQTELLDRKVGFSNLCKEYMEIKSQLEIPDMTINHNELNNRLLEIRQMSDFLNECLDYVTLDIMKTYSFNQQALKVIVDIKKLKLKAKDYGFIPDALIPYTDIPVILQKMYDDNNINKKPKRTVLMDWFDINEKVMINKVRYYKILGIKN